MSKPVEFVCNDSLCQRIRLNLGKFQVLQHENNGLKKAAVAITIVDVFHGPDLNGLSTPDYWDKAAALILTRRTSQLRHHYPGIV
jgi:hypothetical protein